MRVSGIEVKCVLIYIYVYGIDALMQPGKPGIATGRGDRYGISMA